MAKIGLTPGSHTRSACSCGGVLRSSQHALSQFENADGGEKDWLVGRLTAQARTSGD